MSLLIFLFLCLISVAVGIGALYILGFRKQNDPVFLSSPLIALCIWSLFLGIGVSLSVPVRILTYLIWSISLVLCLVTFKFYRHERLLPPLIACAVIALSISFPYLAHDFSDYTGSPFPDGWSYIAFGQYLWEYPRCTEGGLAPLYQYAAHLCQTRFVAASFLGFISPLAGWPGDTQAASGYFFPWAFFVYASACVFFIWKRVSKLLVWAYVILAVVTGWLFTAMSANNFDQALAIGFLPAVAGFLKSVNFTERRWGILLAIVLSSTVYIYPEMTPFIFLSTFLLLIFHVLRDKIQVTPLISLGAIFILLFGLLVSVYAANWLDFIQAQFSTMENVVRPGESIALELISQKYWFPGLWGLGADISTSNQMFSLAIDWIRYTCALMLSVYALIGFFMLIRQKRFGLIAVHVFLSVLISYFVLIERYGYGGYKLILLSWWLVSYFVVLGVEWIQAQERLASLRTLNQYFFILVLGAIMYVTLLREQQFDKTIMIRDISPYQELNAIQSVVQNSPIGISVTDPIANLWAVYYLRESITHMFYYQTQFHMSQVHRLMLRSEQVDSSEIAYLLTDAKGFRAQERDMVWHNSIYALWSVKDSPCFIVRVENPNGLETVNEKPFFWINNEATKIVFFASRAGHAELLADFSPGPSAPEITRWNLMVRTDSGIEDAIVIGENSDIHIPVKPGLNEITLQSLDQQVNFEFPKGDRRIMLMGISDLRLVCPSGQP